MCTTRLPFEAHLDNMTNGLQLGTRYRNLGPSWAQVAGSPGSPAQVGHPGPISRIQCDMLKFAFLPRYPMLLMFFGFDGGLCGAMFPVLTEPTCVQTCPSCAMLGPKLGAIPWVYTVLNTAYMSYGTATQCSFQNMKAVLYL
jgi:hypothetical protein